MAILVAMAVNEDGQGESIGAATDMKGYSMSQYTELLNIQAETLQPDEDGYEESLLETATLFRGFDMALTSFIQEHGYTEDSANAAAKAKFLRKKFKAAKVKPPRDFKAWFSPGAEIKRLTAYKICFALGLDVAETNDFFRRVQFERGFDCHTVNEAVYYFCIKNKLSYSEAHKIIDRIPAPKKVRTLPNREVLYTGTILEYINQIDDKEKLIEYITYNISDFQYNNATAIQYIQELWTEISKAEGLAVQEGRIIDKYNRFENRHKKGDADMRSAEVIDEEVRHQNQNVKPEDAVVASADSSTWTIFSQILGLSNYTESKYAAKRSLTSILSENALMPLNAGYCFPSQQNIDGILRGELADNELMRKMLIFLVFYTYCAKMIISKNDVYYLSRPSDADRCLETINGRLLSAGYPELYSGNPYDWLFMWSLNDEHPLVAFRDYMGEVFTIKENCSVADD